MLIIQRKIHVIHNEVYGGLYPEINKYETYRELKVIEKLLLNGLPVNQHFKIIDFLRNYNYSDEIWDNIINNIGGILLK